MESDLGRLVELNRMLLISLIDLIRKNYFMSMFVYNLLYLRENLPPIQDH